MANSKSVPAKLSFTVKQGDTFRRIFKFRVKGDPPTPISLAGSAVKLIIDGEEDLSLGNGLTIQGAGNDEIYLQKNITWAGRKKIEFQVTFPSGIIKTYYAGLIISKAELDE